MIRCSATKRPINSARGSGSPAHRRRIRHARANGSRGHLDWQDRSLRRPLLSLRELNATFSKGKLTGEFGKQFIRWGKADLLNPTDRFAPKDFLSVTDPGFLAVTAARAIYDTGVNSIDLVWQPRFTPSRTPLLDQRWTVLPESLAGVSLNDLGSQFPGRSSFGARWNHVGAGYEVSASFYDGFNSLPLFQAAAGTDFRRIYPALRLYGADAAVPLPWFTVKAEAAYYTSPDKQQDEYVIYVIQFERQIKEFSIVAGYAGDAVTSYTPGLQFSPELGFARAILAHAQYTIDSTRSVATDAAIRQNGQGSWLRTSLFAKHRPTLARNHRIRLDSRRSLGFPGPIPSQLLRAAHPALQFLAAKISAADCRFCPLSIDIPVRLTC